MRLLIITALTVLTILTAVCIGEEAPATSLVTKPGIAAYYTTLDAALGAAKGSQFVVVEFYTDW